VTSPWGPMVVRTEGGFSAQEGESIGLKVPDEAIYLFDGESGENLLI